MMKIQETIHCLQMNDGILRNLLYGIYQTEDMPGDMWKEQGDERHQLLHEIGDHLIEISILIEELKKEQDRHQINTPLTIINGGRNK